MQYPTDLAIRKHYRAWFSGWEYLATSPAQLAVVLARAIIWWHG